MPESRYSKWPVFRCSWVAAFGCSLTLTHRATAGAEKGEIMERTITIRTLAAALMALLMAPALGQRTSVSSDFPIYDNGGKPDLTIDPKRFVSQMEIVDRYFAPDDCALVE